MKKAILFLLATATFALTQTTTPATPTVALAAVSVAAPTLAQCAALVPASGSTVYTICAYGAAPNLGLAVSVNGSTFVPIGGGVVKTVNGKAPDTNGDVTLKAATTVTQPSATTALQ